MCLERKMRKNSLLKAAFLGTSLLAIAGCQSTPKYTSSIVASDVRDRHPIYLETNQNVLEIATGTNVHLDSAQAAKLDAFATAYRREGEKSVYLLAPSGGQNDGVATALVAPIRHRLISQGVSPSSIVYQTYDATGMGAAPIRLSYETLEAKAGPCGQWPQDITKVTANRSWQDFGCSSQNNLAQMVANKEDLITQRDTTPGNTARRVDVLEKYQSGEQTVADTSSSKVNLSDTKAD